MWQYIQFLEDFDPIFRDVLENLRTFKYEFIGQKYFRMNFRSRKILLCLQILENNSQMTLKTPERACSD